MMIEKNYEGLIQFQSFEERFMYLRFEDVSVGSTTFGENRYINQSFYASHEWKVTRARIITRDDGCDLALPGSLISGLVIVHHIVPITEAMFVSGSDLILDPNNLVCVPELTHRAIHFGKLLVKHSSVTLRTKNDTTLW